MHGRVAPLLVGLVLFAFGSSPSTEQERRYLYVAVPGVAEDAMRRDVAILVFDIDDHHKFVRRIPIWSAAEAETARGIAVGGSRLYLSTTRRLGAIDLLTEKVVWENNYGGHCCDRIALSRDGQTIYAPAFGAPQWYIVDSATGALSAPGIQIMGWPREAIVSRSGGLAYLSAWESQVLSIADTRSRAVVKEIGPFSANLCPFTINAAETVAFANIDGLVGFEVGDLHTGLILDRVVVEGYSAPDLARYECPSHGIALTPDERELWVSDGVGNRMQIFDATTYPPVLKTVIDLERQPRWVTFSIDGRFAYASTGDVFDSESKRRTASLKDADGNPVESEKMLEVDFAGRTPVRAGQQIGAGRQR